jgi:hypothetical protein
MQKQFCSLGLFEQNIALYNKNSDILTNSSVHEFITNIKFSLHNTFTS